VLARECQCVDVFSPAMRGSEDVSSRGFATVCIALGRSSHSSIALLLLLTWRCVTGYIYNACASEKYVREEIPTPEKFTDYLITKLEPTTDEDVFPYRFACECYDAQALMSVFHTTHVNVRGHVHVATL